MPKLIPVDGLPKTFGRRSPNGAIYYQATIGTLGQVSFSTGEKTAKLAKKAARIKEQELLRNEKNSHRPFADFAHALYDELKKHWRLGTQKAARNVIFNFLVPFFGDMAVGNITDSDWELFLDELLRIHPGRDLENTRKFMRMIMRKAKTRELTTRTLELRIPERHRRPGKWLKPDAIDKLIRHASTDRLKLQMAMTYTMLMRPPGEIVSLKKSDVDLERQLISIRAENTKTGRPRAIAISPLILPLLRRQMEQFPNSPWVFPKQDGSDGHQNTFWWEFDLARRTAAIDCIPYDLRHSAFREAIYIHKVELKTLADYGGTSVRELEDTYLRSDAEVTRPIASVLPLGGTIHLAGKAIAKAGEE